MSRRRPRPSKPAGRNLQTGVSLRGRLILPGIILFAAILRLMRPGDSPPGLNQDEAISAWISWCLLKTGHDMTGQPWPIFYTHGIGDNPATLFFYTLMPFQALFGLSAWSTRLAAAVSGIACIPLIASIGADLFGPAVGVIAAAMLAVNPWHLFLSRFGVGASQCPLFALLSIALLLRARLPLTDALNAEHEEVRPWWAAVAGLTAGISCYSFYPMRIYFPVLFLLIALAMGSAWRRLFASSRGRAAFALFVLGFGLTFGPLAWQHLVDPAIGRRWEMTRLWAPGTPPLEIMALVLGRYALHFHPDFLFMRGDLFAIMKPIGQGEFGWYMLPCMLAGLGLVVVRLRSSRSARLLLVLLLAYPVGDVVSRYMSVHSLRSAPGVGALVLLAAWGGVESGRWLWGRNRRLAVVAAGGLLAAVVGQDTRYLMRFFGEYNRKPEIYYSYHTDLLEASRWLEPRLDQYDAVFCTTTGMIEPFAVTLVGLKYDPRRWLSEARERHDGEYDIYLRYGKMHFMYGQLWVPELQALANNGRQDRVLFIIRPGELGLSHPLYVVRDPQGKDALWVCGRVL